MPQCGGVVNQAAGGAPERFFELLRRDLAKWQKVVAYANIKAGT